MHYYALVEIPADATDVDSAVAVAMETHREREEGDGLVGIWDWYSIGGRWTGRLDGFDPRTDRRNMKQCFLCHGTGRRMDELGRAHRVDYPEYGCNGCDSTGIQYKHASEWARHPGDVSSRGLLNDGHKPYTLITANGEFSKERWNGESFDDTSADLDSAWSGLSADARLVVVDYHC